MHLDHAPFVIVSEKIKTNYLFLRILIYNPQRAGAYWIDSI